MQPKSKGYVVGHGTKQAIGKLMLLVEQSLDDDWTLETMAARVGYAKHHFSRAFSMLVGTSPLAYVRTLRLHRSAHRLATMPDVEVFAVAREAGYASMKAFRRAFEREFDRTPSDFRREHRETRAREARSHAAPPEGMTPRPTIELVGPLTGISLRSPGLSVDEMTQTLMRLFALAKPSGAFTIGSASPPWGWTGGGATRREFRCIYITDVTRPPEPPLEPWSMGIHRYARFDFDGPMSAVRSLYPYAFDVWLPKSRWRYAFAPVVTLYDDAVWHASAFQRAHARLFIPIERA